MSLRSERRRQQREQQKAVKKYLKPPMYVGNKSAEEFAAELGLKKEELEAWTDLKSAELERLYQQRYDAVVKECNKKLKDGFEEYNRNLRQFEKDLKKEYRERETQREKAMIEAFNKKFYESENYICLVNILLAVRTVHNTWGYTKAIQRFLDTWNQTNEEIRRIGVQETLRRVNEEFGLDLEFDSFEIEEFIKRCGKNDLKGAMVCLETA